MGHQALSILPPLFAETAEELSSASLLEAPFSARFAKGAVILRRGAADATHDVLKSALARVFGGEKGGFVDDDDADDGIRRREAAERRARQRRGGGLGGQAAAAAAAAAAANENNGAPDDGRDVEALLSLFSALDGDHWTRRDHWGSDRPLREWFGVTVEEFDVPASSVALDEEPRSDLLEEDGAGAADAPDADRESKQKMARRSRVVKLDLNDNNMGGQLPEGALAALTELSELMIDSNRIRGPFPSTIGSLWHIRKLNMAYNHFSGPIPSSICRLKKLRKLLLQDNHLSGSVPECIADLDPDMKLDLSHNPDLEPPIPDTVSSFRTELKRRGRTDERRGADDTKEDERESAKGDDPQEGGLRERARKKEWSRWKGAVGGDNGSGEEGEEEEEEEEEYGSAGGDRWLKNGARGRWSERVGGATRADGRPSMPLPFRSELGSVRSVDHRDAASSSSSSLSSWRRHANDDFSNPFSPRQGEGFERGGNGVGGFEGDRRPQPPARHHRSGNDNDDDEEDDGSAKGRRRRRGRRGREDRYGAPSPVQRGDDGRARVPRSPKNQRLPGREGFAYGGEVDDRPATREAAAAAAGGGEDLDEKWKLRQRYSDDSRSSAVQQTKPLPFARDFGTDDHSTNPPPVGEGEKKRGWSRGGEAGIQELLDQRRQGTSASQWPRTRSEADDPEVEAKEKEERAVPPPPGGEEQAGDGGHEQDMDTRAYESGSDAARLDTAAEKASRLRGASAVQDMLLDRMRSSQGRLRKKDRRRMAKRGITIHGEHT